MKQVLVIDENEPFREYLKSKLTENGINVLTAVNTLDGIAKIRTEVPDIVILDYHLSRRGCFEVLQSKKTNPNTVNMPVIVMARQLDQKKVVALLPYNVKKVFTKPVKIDALFAALTEILQVSFSLDETPGIVEVHVNEDILFIEIAQGLNRDKLDMLKFKINELLDLNSIKTPKIIVMLSDMVLSFADAPNLQKLLEVVSQTAQIKLRHIRILTRDVFVRKFIEGRKEYEGIEVASNLQYAIDGLLEELDGAMEYAEKKAEIIGDKLLSHGGSAEGEAMQLRFEAESRPKKIDAESLRDFFSDINVAAVDNDPAVLEIIKSAFRITGGAIKTYTTGGEFLDALGSMNFDLVFLALQMPGMDGFAVLRDLAGKNNKVPVIMMSSLTGRETVIKAFQQGIKGYIVKPVLPDVIISKILEILKPSI